MEKICPLMSRAVTISDYWGNPGDRVADMRYEECAKEKCELWIKAVSTDPGIGPKRIYREAGCSYKILAVKP